MKKASLEAFFVCNEKLIGVLPLHCCTQHRLAL